MTQPSGCLVAIGHLSGHRASCIGRRDSARPPPGRGKPPYKAPRALRGLRRALTAVTVRKVFDESEDRKGLTSQISVARGWMKTTEPKVEVSSWRLGRVSGLHHLLQRLDPPSAEPTLTETRCGPPTPRYPQAPPRSLLPVVSGQSAAFKKQASGADAHPGAMETRQPTPLPRVVSKQGLSFPFRT